MKINEKGFSAVEGLLILIIVSIIGGAGWYVWNANNKAQDSLDNADASSSTTANLKSKKGNFQLPAGWQWYENKELSVKFAYPKAYGEATLSSSKNETGTLYVVSFAEFEKSDNNSTSVSFATKGYERKGIGSVCNLGIAQVSGSYEPLKTDTGDWGSSRSLLNEQNESAIESVSYDSSDVDGGSANCMDAQVELFKNVSGAKVATADVFYTERTKQAAKLKSQAEYDKEYKANPNNFINSQVRNEVLAIGKSITNL
jgi:hypothetical protein